MKLQSIADGVQKEGGKWVTIQLDLDHPVIGRFRRLQPTPIPLSKAAAKKLTELEGKLEELQAQLAGDENGDEDILYQQIEALEDAIEKIHRNQTGGYDDATKTKCGVVVSIAQNGQPELTYGLLRKEDEIALVHREGTSSETASAQAALMAQHRDWLAVLPRSASQLWQWCLAKISRLFSGCSPSVPPLPSTAYAQMRMQNKMDAYNMWTRWPMLYTSIWRNGLLPQPKTVSAGSRRHKSPKRCKKPAPRWMGRR